MILPRPPLPPNATPEQRAIYEYQRAIDAQCEGLVAYAMASLLGAFVGFVFALIITASSPAFTGGY